MPFKATLRRQEVTHFPRGNGSMTVWNVHHVYLLMHVETDPLLILRWSCMLLCFVLDCAVLGWGWWAVRRRFQRRCRPLGLCRKVDQGEKKWWKLVLHWLVEYDSFLCCRHCERRRHWTPPVVAFFFFSLNALCPSWWLLEGSFSFLASRLLCRFLQWNVFWGVCSEEVMYD